MIADLSQFWKTKLVEVENHRSFTFSKFALIGNPRMMERPLLRPATPDSPTSHTTLPPHALPPLSPRTLLKRAARKAIGGEVGREIESGRVAKGGSGGGRQRREGKGKEGGGRKGEREWERK